MRITGLLIVCVVMASCELQRPQGEEQSWPLYVARAEAQEENRGVSWILQMCSEATDCSAIKKSYKDAAVLNAGWMYLTSNANRCKCAPEFLKDPRPKRIRVDICNSTCFPERGRRCQAHECFAGMNAAQASQAVLSNNRKVYETVDKAIRQAKGDIRQAAGSLEVAVKACLECTLTERAREKLNGYVRAKFDDMPGTRFVDNPLQGKCFAGYLCERHGEPAGGQSMISDNDGLDYDTIDQWKYWKKNRQAYMVLGWKGCNNGLAKGEGFIPPQNRKNYCTGSRDGMDFASATGRNSVAITSELDPRDRQGCKNALKAPDGPKGFVLKLGDGRTNAVFLAPEKQSQKVFKRVELRKHGAVVDESKPGPGWRYGRPYEHDPAGRQRRIYDMRKHPNEYEDNSVLFADGNCWTIEKPRFRVD